MVYVFFSANDIKSAVHNNRPAASQSQGQCGKQSRRSRSDNQRILQNFPRRKFRFMPYSFLQGCRSPGKMTQFLRPDRFFQLHNKTVQNFHIRFLPGIKTPPLQMIGYNIREYNNIIRIEYSICL